MKIFLLKISFFLIPVGLLFIVLFKIGFYPAITDNTAFDLKMIHLAKHPIEKPEVISIGSSSTLFQLDSRKIISAVKLPYYNLAAWSLQITDSRRLTEHFVRVYKPRYLILGTNLMDFKRKADQTLLNFITAPSKAQGKFPEYFYLQKDNSVYRIARRKLWEWPHRFDQWGQEIIDYRSDTSWIKIWKTYDDPFPTAFTQENYADLKRLAVFLEARKIKLIFIQFPVAPEYLDSEERKRDCESTSRNVKTWSSVIKEFI